jgi:catalase-peroxidase
LSTDFFVNLLDIGTVWGPSAEPNVYDGRSRGDGRLRWTATRADLVFGSNSQLRAIAEIYAQEDGAERFVQDFVRAWVKVMELDRFDLRVGGR